MVQEGRRADRNSVGCLDDMAASGLSCQQAPAALQLPQQLLAGLGAGGRALKSSFQHPAASWVQAHAHQLVAIQCRQAIHKRLCCVLSQT